MKTIRLIQFLVFIYALACAFYPKVAYAEPSESMLTTDISKYVDGDFFQPNLGVFITKFVDMALIVGAIGALFYLIIGAIQWITSGGDSGKMESAGKHISSAVIGLGVLASIWILWLVLLYFLGFNRFSNLHLPSLRGGGGGGVNEWRPFRDYDDWAEQFEDEHGRWPDNQDIADFKAGRDYAEDCGLSSVPQEAWEYHDRHGVFPPCP
ncbi:MAG: pilin [Patescibacteria group bacterium]|jgi:hypothetical protein